MRSLKYIFLSFLVLTTSNVPIISIKAELTPADRERLNNELQSLNEEMNEIHINQSPSSISIPNTPNNQMMVDLENPLISFETESEVKDSVSTIASARKIPPKAQNKKIDTTNTDPLENINLNDLERKSLNQFN